MHIVEDIKKIKSKYGSTYFEKKGLHAVLNDLSNNIDKRFVSVLKKADELSLPEKLKKLRNEEDSIQAIQVSNLRQDFVENTGLESKIAALVFDVYLFGLGLKQDLNPLDYKATQVSNGIQLNELIELALADKRLEKNEMANIFNKGKFLGLDEDKIFDTLVKCIKKHNLKPLPYSDIIQPISKEILVKYDWVDESIIKEEHKKAKDIEIDKEREQRRLLAIQKEQALADQKEKELERKRIELELKKRELEVKEKAERKNHELEKRKELELKKQKRAQYFKSFLNWFTKKDVKNSSPLSWTFIIIFFGAIIIFVVLKNTNRENKLKDAQELSYKLEKKYEIVKTLIYFGKIDSATILLKEIVHPSDELSSYEKDGFLAGAFRFNEYWEMKRNELRSEIDSLSGINYDKNQSKVKNKEQVKKEVSLGIYKIDDYYDGFSPLKEAPTLQSRTIINVNHGVKVDVLIKSGLWWKVSLNDGKIGYIHESRLIAHDKLSIPPWKENGIEKSEWEYLIKEGYYERPYMGD
jgi:hypothetical protein